VKRKQTKSDSKGFQPERDQAGERMSEADDYESLPASTPLAIVATAGAVAGIAEHCAMYPIDSVKVIFISIQNDIRQFHQF
jgi:hypothetical protein